MAHYREWNWTQIEQRLANTSRNLLKLLSQSREFFETMQAGYLEAAVDDGTGAGPFAERDESFAKILFNTDLPSATQISQVEDFRQAITAINQIIQFADGEDAEALGTDDRLTKLRLMGIPDAVEVR